VFGDSISASKADKRTQTKCHSWFDVFTLEQGALFQLLKHERPDYLELQLNSGIRTSFLLLENQTSKPTAY